METDLKTNSMEEITHRRPSASKSQSRDNNPDFLWWCAGADGTILSNLSKEEQNKYTGIGGAVLSTWTFASISGGYAIYRVFENGWWALILGIIWGLVIFNLDRFLVSTIKKYNKSKKEQFFIAFPRILLAVLIGIAVSKPLEMRIFKKEIDDKLLEVYKEKEIEQDSTIQRLYRPRINDLITEKNSFINRRNQIETEINELKMSYMGEADGTSGSLKKGINRITILKKEQYDYDVKKRSPELDSIDLSVKKIDAKLASIEVQKINDNNFYKNQINKKSGLLNDYKALAELSDENDSVYYFSLIITMLIILIELGPIIAKILLDEGPYDVKIGTMEQEKILAMEEYNSKKSEEITELYAKKRKQDKLWHSKVLDTLSEYKDEETIQDIKDWKEGKLNTQKNQDRIPINELLLKLKELYDYDINKLF